MQVKTQQLKIPVGAEILTVDAGNVLHAIIDDQAPLKSITIVMGDELPDGDLHYIGWTGACHVFEWR